MFWEDLAFCIKRADWKVKKIYSHLTFEQARFKRKFILMNQKSRQQSKNDIEKIFYKLIINSNFGYDCRNNLDNCKFVPIFDELKEISDINRYNIFNPKISEFVTADLLKADVEEKFNNKLMELDKEDTFYEIKLQILKTERLTDLESAEKFEQKNKTKNKKRTKLIDFTDRQNEAVTNKKVKSLIDFDEEYSHSIRSIAIEKSSKVNLTTQVNFEWKNVDVQ